MKATGIVRQIDQMGRVVLPKELRKTLGIEDGTPLEIFVYGGRIILQKYQPYAYTVGELKEALIAAAKDAGKGPATYLQKSKGESL